VFADVDAGDIRANRIKLAANFGGRIGFEIDHILMRRSAGQEDHDDRLVRPSDAGSGFGAQDLGERQPAHCESADLQERAPRNSAARLAMRDRSHRRPFEHALWNDW
jgi:hypothetical protein